MTIELTVRNLQTNQFSSLVSLLNTTDSDYLSNELSTNIIWLIEFDWTN